LNDVKKVVSDASYANAGAFIGITGGGIFRDISINNVGLVKGYMAGGFGGYLVTNLSGNGVEEAKNVIFENIKLTNIGTKGDDNTGIVSSGSWAGGFFASMQNYDREDTKINNIYMNNINQIKSNQDSAGFTTGLGAGSVSNIHIENIGKIESTSIGKSSVAGFIGDVKDGVYKNISVKNIESIVSRSNSSQAWSGGFIGSATAGTFENITFSGIGSMSYNGYYFGLFIGQVGDISNKDNRVVLKNIVVHDIGDLKCEGWNCDRGDFSGFIGDFGGKANLENIHVFLDKNYEQANVLFSDFTWVSMDDINFDNVNMYYKNGSFANVKNKEEYYKGKINFIKYNENELANKKQDFITSAQTNTGLQYDKTSNSFKTTSDFKVTDPKFSTIGEGGEGGEGSDAKLDENDLHQNIIKDEIIADIANGKYKLHISDLLKMLEDKANYSNMSENQKLEFVANYFLNGDKIKALEVVQSLDFLLAYEKNGLSTASKDKFEGNGFNTKENILKQVNNTTKIIKDKINKLEKDLKPLANSSNGYLKDLIAKQNELDVVIKAYNKYVVLINKGLAHKNDPEFIILKNKIDTLIKDSQVLADSINKNQEGLSIWQNKNNTENFKVTGAFANGVLNTNPKLDEITGEGGDGEDPNKPELPETDLEFEQTASLNLIGDESLDEEEETQEIDEAALTQRTRTCIVSDN
ncbi:hypothetical protein, partial [Campylobacter peloridis]|uniref:hypothetical protein n=1 Tax=Campylobacter peloridis TaxID=488546 RepID=UPI001650A2DF